MISRRMALSAAALAAGSFPTSAIATSSTERPIRILSIDGGGVRGVAAAAVLAALDERMHQAGLGGVADYFDVFAGTSTGSIIAAGLAGAGASPGGLVKIYRERGHEIFRGAYWRAFFDRVEHDPIDWLGPKFLSDGLLAVLHEELNDLSFRDLTRNLVVPFYSLGSPNDDSETPGAVIVSGGPKLGPNAAQFADLRVRDVVTASCSAPTYFNPFPVADTYLGVDGGIFANNPSAQALTLAQAAWGFGKTYQVVSFGCGLKPLRYKPNKTWGRVEWLSIVNGLPLLEAVFDSQSSGTWQLVERALTREGVFRFDFGNGDDDGGMDDASGHHIEYLLGAAQKYIKNGGFQSESDRFLAAAKSNSGVRALF